MNALLEVTKIEILRDCEVGYEHLIHIHNGCDCSVPDRKWLYAGEVLEEYELRNTDISDLKLNEDFKVLEVK